MDREADGGAVVKDRRGNRALAPEFELIDRGGTMIRWPMLVVGIGLLVLSLVVTAKFPMLPLEPEVLDVQGATALAQETAYHYVQVSGTPDLDRKVYPTLSVRPVYTGRPPTEKYDVCRPGESLPADLDSYLGTAVRIARPLESKYVALQTVYKKKGQEDELMRERLLAPVSGCEGRIWAISAAYKADDSARHLWPQERTVEGVLTRLADVNRNMRSHALEHDWKDIKVFVERELDTTLLDHAYLILTDYEWHPPTYFYCPLQGSNNTVFAVLNKERVATLSGSVTGVFEPAPHKWYDEFADVLGESLPDRIGIVTMETAEQYNHRQASNAAEMKYTGAGLTALGLAGILVRKLRTSRTRKRRAAKRSDQRVPVVCS